MPRLESRPHRTVVMIGSSGGGTATLGHTKPADFVQTIANELSNINEPVRMREVIFVSLSNGQGMDSATESDEASLFHLRDGYQRVQTGTLGRINEMVMELEESIANDIELGKVDAVISVSCKPTLFAQTLEAAAACSLPLTGTGGTSLSIIASDYRVKLVGNAGGSVATTPLTKAISFSNALAKAWGLRYRPWLGTAKNCPSWRSVLNSCLPAFWAVVLGKRALRQWNMDEWIPDSNILLEVLQSYALPMACSIVMANSRRSSPGVLIAATMAAASCKRTILGGLLAGWIVAFLEERTLYFCILHGTIPATMTNLLTTGFVGIFVAAIMAPIAPRLAELTENYRSIITFAIQEQTENELLEVLQILGMSLAGSIFCYGSKVGWYHSVFLPLILIEMEIGDPAILGAMDQLSLVLVSAGICAGVWFTSLVLWSSKDVSLQKRGILINLLCGDFIEACYPLMEKNSVVRLGGYLASSCSVGLLSIDCKSSAYLPFPVALWLADDFHLLSLASKVAFCISFVFSVLGFLLSPTSHSKDKGT